MNIIKNVDINSIAQEVGIEKGDTLVSINHTPISDIFDYRFHIKNENLEVLINKKNGEEWIIEIEKEEDEDLGLSFSTPLMDEEKTCKNKCVFCFIDQNPSGMRNTIYFKDDDSRLSFLEGNFVTLTNMSHEALDRVIFHRLSPVNISVHTTDPKLRVEMLKNPRSALIMEQISKLTAARLTLNFQIVLCKGINDKEHLDKSIEDLSQFLPYGQGLAIVPLGLTKHRANLPKLKPITKEDAIQTIAQVHKWQEKIKSNQGTNFAYLADEFYIMAGHPLPVEEEYEGYTQIENGIGMARSFIEEFLQEMEVPLEAKTKEISVVTGTLFYNILKDISNKIEEKYHTKIHLYPITNNFYGDTITVSGLITGGDIINQLRGKNLGQGLLLPKSLLKKNEDLLLDNVTLGEISKELKIDVIPVNPHGGDFLRKTLGLEETDKGRNWNSYE